MKEQDNTVRQESSVTGDELTALTRHEIEPTTQFSLTPGPGRDSFLFYHVKAAKVDLNPLWAYCKYCVSNLTWVNDHFMITPNPCFMVQSEEFEERFSKIKKVLLYWYEAKGWMAGIDLGGI